MNAAWQHVRRLFERALDVPHAERASWLAAEAPDADVRRQVERLLAAEQQAGDFLEPPSGTTAPPHQLGSFHLRQPLGSGGMGTVWLAEQQHPHRRVAVKVMHTGFVAAGHRDRFRAEIDILARLQHPGIAQVYEAGVEADGTTWFALELLEGATSITTAPRDGQPLASTLRTFLAACDAVQHAHQRGVIHRDLKPANILRLPDGSVKVIDFGIARVLDADGTQHTRHGELLGTLAYMSPEQVEGHDTDVRTDVYGLGVVLHELVTGTRPFDLEGMALTTACRVIVEREPPPVRRLMPDLPAELDWIVGRALQKLPADRYAGVADLAADVRRLLRHEPVAAAPPSLAYRARKFARRHRVGVAAAAMVFAVSIGAFATTAVALLRTREAEAAEREGRQQAEAANRQATAALDFLLGVFETVHPGKEGRDVKMVDALASTAATFDRTLQADPTIRAALGRAIGIAFLGLGQLPEAELRLRDSLAVHEQCFGPDHERTAQVAADLGSVLIERGQLDDAEALLQRASRVTARLATDSSLSLHCELHRGNLLRARGDKQGAIRTLRPVVDLLRQRRPDARQTLLACNLLAGVLHECGDLDAADSLYQAALDGFRARGEHEHPEALAATNNLLMLRNSRGPQADSVPEFERLIAARQRVLGPNHPDTIGTLSNFAGLLYMLGRIDEAADRFAEALTAMSAQTDDRDRIVQTLLSNLAKLEARRGNHAVAAGYAERVLASRRTVFGDHHEATLLSMSMLADIRRLEGRFDDALALLAETERLAAAAEPPQVLNQYRALVGVAHCQVARSDFAAAEQALLRSRALYEHAEAANPIKGQLPRPESLLTDLYRAWGKPEQTAPDDGR